MRALARHLGTGLALGAEVGIVARVFMALLTQDPQFSWSGTGFIIGLFALAGLAFGLTYDLRQRYRSRWWKVLALPAVLVGFGPGAAMVPGVLGLALVPSRRRWVRALGVVVTSGWLVVVAVLMVRSEEPMGMRTLAGVALMVGCCAALAAGARLSLTGWRAPTPAGAESDRPATPAPVARPAMTG